MAREVKFSVREQVENKMATTVEEMLDDVLRKTIHDAQGGIPAVVYDLLSR